MDPRFPPPPLPTRVPVTQVGLQQGTPQPGFSYPTPLSPLSGMGTTHPSPGLMISILLRRVARKPHPSLVALGGRVLVLVGRVPLPLRPLGPDPAALLHRTCTAEGRAPPTPRSGEWGASLSVAGSSHDRDLESDPPRADLYTQAPDSEDLGHSPRS